MLSFCVISLDLVPRAASSPCVRQDWNDGRIPYYTVPPSRGNEGHAAAAVVGQWAKEFDAEEVGHVRGLPLFRCNVLKVLSLLTLRGGRGPVGQGV